MGYVGTAPGSLFIWGPAQVGIGDEWRTLITEFETGWEQRRQKWVRPRMNVRMRYPRGLHTADVANDVWRFWKAMQGPLKSFELPLFGRLTTVDAAFTAGGSQMTVGDTQDFTTSATSRWNKIYIETPDRLYDTFSIATVVDTTQIQLSDARLGNVDFGVDYPISPVITARFADDLMSLEYLVALMSTAGISFSEVRS